MATKQSNKREEEEDEMDSSEMLESVLEGYKAAHKIGTKLFGVVSLSQVRELYGFLDDDFDEETLETFEDDLRSCQEELINLNAGSVLFDDVVGLYVDAFIGDVD